MRPIPQTDRTTFTESIIRRHPKRSHLDELNLIGGSHVASAGLDLSVLREASVGHYPCGEKGSVSRSTVAGTGASFEHRGGPHTVCGEVFIQENVVGLEVTMPH